MLIEPSGPRGSIMDPMEPQANPNKIWIVLTALLALVLIGGGVFGWLKIKGLQDERDAARAEVSTLNAQQSKEPEKTEKVEYLEIREWGVRMRLTPNLADLQYSYSTSQGREGIYFSKKSLVDTEAKYRSDFSNNGCSAEHGPLGAVGKYVASDNYKDGKAKDIAGAIKVGDFYYIFDSPQATCSDHQDVVKLQTPAGEAFKTLEATPQ